MKNFQILFIVAIFSFIFISCDNQNNAENTSEKEVVRTRKIKKIGTYKNLTAIEFRHKMESKPGTILDVRELDDVRYGVIEGAVIVPLYADNFQDVINALQKDIPIYVYDGSGSLSVIAAKTLLSNEFSEIYGLMGGITAWGMEGYKTVNPKIIKGEF
jgi:rhodanese-related sulfurtransferase